MDPELPLFAKLVYSSGNDGNPGRGNNPFVPFIESMSSRHIRLLNKVNGEFRISIGEPSSHPDAILTEAKNVAQKEKVLSPCAPTLRSRDEILADYDLLYNCGKISQTGTFKQMIKLQPPHFTRSPIESLTHIMISDMMLHKIHKGNFLLCRTISPAVRMVAIQVAVEDQAGDVADLALYNSFDTAGADHDGITGILPLGQVILIREPWFKLGSTGGNPTIRVDTPSDIILLEFDHPRLQDAPESWREKPNPDLEAYRLMGNEALKKNNLEAAIRAYSTGLTVDPSASSLRLGRSQCYLKLGYLSLALKDAQAASEDESLPSLVRMKAQYRTAEVLYAMDRFTQALEILQDEAISKYSPGDLYTLRKKAQARLLEQSSGNYDWFALSKLADEINGKHPIPDVADYIGPVKVARMNNVGGGRGLITTRAAMAGELLMVSKPFAFASPLEFPDLLRAFKLEGTGIVERAYYEVVGRAARRIMGDHTSASSLFLDLHPGNDYVNVSPAEMTSSLPSFLSHGAHQWMIPGDYPTTDVDINKIEGIIASSSFSNEINGYDLGKTEAVYSLPSLMNHSCHGTAVRTHIGSVVAVRASRDMKEGDEVTCSYMGIGEHVGSSYLHRAPALKKWLDNCRCPLCRSDREDGEDRCQQREEYNSQLATARTQRLHPSNTELFKDLQVLVSNIKSTYRKGRKEPMDTLGLAQRVLAFMSQQNARLAIREYIDALKSHGIVVKAAPPKRIPQTRSDIQRRALIIETNSFPSQSDTLYRCIKVMNTIASLEFYHGKLDKASHWAIACLWTHETFYGPGKEYLWRTLSIDNPLQNPLGQLLKSFDSYTAAQARKLKGTGPIVDVADYVGPVKVVAAEGVGGGRELVTTQAVRAGDLLVVAKPYAYASPLKFSELLRGFNAERSIVHERSLYELMGRTMRRVMGDHSAASALLLHVYPGAGYTPRPQPTTENDLPKPTFLPGGGRHWELPDPYPTSHIDFNQIEGIICDSSFSLPIKDYTLGKTESIYLLPSLGNHSCHATALRNMVGSIMILRASRDLAEGEAVTCSYAENVSVSYLSRAMELKRWIGEDCQCELCSADRSDGDTNCRVREQCSAELAAIASNANRNVKPVNGTFPLIKKTRLTYRDDRTLPREALGYVQMILAQSVELKFRDVAILHYKSGLASFGIRVKDVLPARVPQNQAELERDDLIIETRNFPSQLSSINRVFLTMAALSFWEHQRGDRVRVGH